jgi:choline dehydrogenase
MYELFVEAEKRLGVRTYDRLDLTPFQSLFLEAAPSVELPIYETVNDLDQDEGAAPESVNIRNGVRWNTAFAYLDPKRHLPNLTICGNALVDRLEIRGRCAVAARVVTPAGARRVVAAQFVLAAGAYGTPAILQRSGIGPASLFHELGIDLVIDSPVGENLHDQAFVSIELAGSDELSRRMSQFADERGWVPDEQVIIKARSAVATEAFDLHVFPWSPPDRTTGSRRWFLGGACLTPRSRGTLAIRSRDPERQPRIDNAFLTDSEGYDLAALRSVLALLRSLAATRTTRQLVGGEIGAGAEARTRQEIDDFLRGTVSHYWHPQGTCKMGADDDPSAVCTPHGLVRGLENVRIADCSLIPESPRGFPMLPTIAIAEKISRWMIDEGVTA